MRTDRGRERHAVRVVWRETLMHSFPAGTYMAAYKRSSYIPSVPPALYTSTFFVVKVSKKAEERKVVSLVKLSKINLNSMTDTHTRLCIFFYRRITSKTLGTSSTV